MRIALVILHADTARGGAERYTLDLAAALVERGHDVCILASSFQSRPFAGTAVLINASGITRTGRYLNFINQVEAMRSDSPRRFDVVHAMLPIRSCDIYHPHAGIAAHAMASGHLIKAGRLSRAMSRVGNQFNLRRRSFANIERKLLTEKPPVVFCLSNRIRAVVKKYYPSFSDQKLVSLFNGIDLKRFDPGQNPSTRASVRDQLGIGPDAIMGLMLAQDFERKGLQQAIEAIALAKNPRLVLVVGGKPDASAYRGLASSLGIANQLRFAGPVAQPVDFYKAADFFLLPTFSDPCSLVVLEALAMGLPVISTVLNGACETMIDGVHGRIVQNPRDIRILAKALLEIVDLNRREQMSTACLLLRPRLSMGEHLRLVEKTYAGLTDLQDTK